MYRINFVGQSALITASKAANWPLVLFNLYSLKEL